MKPRLKLIILSVIGLQFFQQSVFAQYKSVALGVKASPSINWMKSDQQGYKSQGISAGIGWGLIAEFYFAENYAFVSGFNLNFQSGRLSYPAIYSGEDVGWVERHYRFKYFEIPVAIKMKTDEISGMRFYGTVGLGFSTRLSSRAEDVRTLVGEPDIETDFRIVNSQTRLFRAAMLIGLGVEVPVTKTASFVTGLQFNNGLNNVLKGNNELDNTSEHQAISNFIELNVGFIF